MNKVLSMKEIHNSIVATKGMILMANQKHRNHGCYIEIQTFDMLLKISRILFTLDLIMNNPSVFADDNKLYDVRKDVTEYITDIDKEMKDMGDMCLT